MLPTIRPGAVAAVLGPGLRGERFARLPRRTATLDPEEIGALLDEMAHGAERPLHAVIVPG